MPQFEKEIDHKKLVDLSNWGIFFKIYQTAQIFKNDINGQFMFEKHDIKI